MSGRNTLAALLLAVGGPAAAADYPPLPYTPPPAVAAGTVVGPHADAAGGCASCAPGGCDKKGVHGLVSRFQRPPAVITLAPGACFGYFPTQWRKWDEVCPYHYSPTAPAQMMKPPVPYPGYGEQPEAKGPNGDLPAPRPEMPKSDTPVKPDPNGARRLPAPPAAARPVAQGPIPVSAHPIPPPPPAARPLPPPPVAPRTLPPLPPIPVPGEKVSSR
jgi:hypothetical protein